MQKCMAELDSCDTLNSLVACEGRVAQVYWQQLAGSSLPWPLWATKRIPAHWTKILPRESGGRNRVRDARDRFCAAINYAYTLLEVEGRVACVAYGLDPDLGLLHVDDRLRESFIYDLIEPLRTKVDALTLAFTYSNGLRPYMFHELRDGVVRLDPDFAKPFTQYVMPRIRRPAMEMAAAYSAQLRRIKVPYRLTWCEVRSTPTTEEPTKRSNCEYCHQPLPRPGLKFCNRQCYLRHSVEIRQPIKLAQARLAELRAEGISPGHGGEAAKKRGSKIAQSNRRRFLGLTGDEYRARKAQQSRERRSKAVRAEGQSDSGEAHDTSH